MDVALRPLFEGLSYLVFYGGSFFGVVACAAALSGALVGFLRFNFNPARIFMGDSGSLFIGADTPIGPAYLGYGRAADGNQSFYFFLGRAF